MGCHWGANVCGAYTRENSGSYLMRLNRGGPRDGCSNDPFSTDGRLFARL
jgi:hypothetical protein